MYICILWAVTFIPMPMPQEGFCRTYSQNRCVPYEVCITVLFAGAWV